MRALLPEYVDGVLAPDRRRQVKDHLETCPECRRAREVAESIPRLLAEPVDPDPPRSLLAEVLQKVSRLQRRSSRGRNTLLSLLVAGLAASGAVAAGASSSRPPGEGPASGAPVITSAPADTPGSQAMAGPTGGEQPLTSPAVSRPDRASGKSPLSSSSEASAPVAADVHS